MELSKVMESINFIKSKVDFVPEVGVILGSGLGEMADKIENRKIVKYSEIPNLPTSTVPGHAGQFVFGKLNGKNVICMQGRIHYYEGYDIENIALPVYIMKYLGIKTLIVTNAAGGVNTSYEPGDLMIIKDHINFAFKNPLIGKNDESIGERFPDMSKTYTPELIKLTQSISKKLNMKVQVGTYFWMTGPCFETPAEIKMIRILGGDAVGMSTVPEVIAAAHCKLNVLGISCITNMAAGILDQPLNHKEVIETSNKVKDKFSALLTEVIGKL